MTSFNSIALNGSTLSVNGTDYNLSLSQTAEATDSSLSSFKGVAAVDNGDGTISLTVGENSVVVEKVIVYPTKGDLITMTLGNGAPAAGTNNTYRVLKVDGTQAEVVAMFDQSTSQMFDGDEDNTYAGSDLDTYLTGWYNGLSADAKSAIVAKTFTQDSWYSGTSGSPIYKGTYWSSASSHAVAYQRSLGSATYGSEITRNVYALSVQDIIDYLGVTSSMTTANTTLTAANIWTMFWNTTSRPSSVTYPWLRSAYAGSSYNALFVGGDYGNVGDLNAGFDRAARPAFTIDLSKIEWNKV